MVNALVVHKAQLPRAQLASRAAQYVRMSTERQQYSIENQATVIAAFAHAHNLTIVRTYRDEGESGLHLKNRDGLKRLLEHVQSGDTDFGHILVYDVSRWGRFQDIDESAHHEFVCKQAGIKVAYCAEQFENDGSMLSSIVKNLKRVMAAEFSRELSAKVHAGVCRLVRNGYAPGGRKGFGIERELVDEKSQSRGVLKPGERKFIATDHIRLRPGDRDEVAIVRWMFTRFLEVKSETVIADELNRKAILTSARRRWTRYSVTRVLKNENYIGNLVYNRHSKKLNSRLVPNPPELWVRTKGCIEPIIERETFVEANKIISERRVDLLTEDEMLSRLRKTLMEEGRLSPRIIDRAVGLPSYPTYRAHFGNLRNAYRLIGYTSNRNTEYLDHRQMWAEEKAKLAAQVAEKLKAAGVRFRCSTDCIELKRGLSISFRTARWRAGAKANHACYWIIQRGGMPDGWIAAIRLTEQSRSVFDYLLLSTDGTSGRTVKFSERARIRRRMSRYETPQALARAFIRRVTMPRRTSLPKPARPNKPSKSNQPKTKSARARH
ncbi:recombinase family protein [Bradyrhizobium manausense]|uniref:recombinase family protein n=1 Tax=Bradyrhizobium manausense TaxID=989370 RepID=UPI001BA848D6|nr:recombinase family protein [Bradyrhizobium manausense]MBR0831419.1 recombinase family protein [Bradyrhizobium manausense]